MASRSTQKESVRIQTDSVQSQFPMPSCVTELRSFMGLINQLGDFTAGISTAADPLRELLKARNEFRWTETHTIAFQKTKKALVSAPTLAHYDPSKPAALHTDASRRKGLGYALLQKHSDKWQLIQCGSRFITDTESRHGRTRTAGGRVGNAQVPHTTTRSASLRIGR